MKEKKQGEVDTVACFSANLPKATCGRADGGTGMKKLLCLCLLPVIFCAVSCGKPHGLDTAQETGRAVIAAAKEGDLGKIYVLLPESYRSDIDRLVKLFVQQLDQQIYDNFAQATSVLVAGLAKHKEKIQAGSLPLPPDLRKEDLLKAVDELQTVWTALKAERLDTFAGLQQAEPGAVVVRQGKVLNIIFRELARVTGEGKTLQDFDAMLARLELKLVKEEEGRTLVKVVNGAQETEVWFKLLDGYWVPEELEADWEQLQLELGTRLDSVLKDIAANRKALLDTSLRYREMAAKFDETGDFLLLLEVLPRR